MWSIKDSLVMLSNIVMEVTPLIPCSTYSYNPLQWFHSQYLDRYHFLVLNGLPKSPKSINLSLLVFRDIPLKPLMLLTFPMLPRRLVPLKPP